MVYNIIYHLIIFRLALTLIIMVFFIKKLLVQQRPNGNNNIYKINIFHNLILGGGYVCEMPYSLITLCTLCDLLIRIMLSKLHPDSSCLFTVLFIFFHYLLQGGINEK